MYNIQVAFYGLGPNSATILTSEVLTLAGIGDHIPIPQINSPLGIYKTLHNVAEGNLVVSLAGLLPGYYATFSLIDSWGCKPIRFMGFSALTVLLAILGKVPAYQNRLDVLIRYVLNSWHLPWS